MSKAAPGGSDSGLGATLELADLQNLQSKSVEELAQAIWKAAAIPWQKIEVNPWELKVTASDSKIYIKN